MVRVMAVIALLLSGCALEAGVPSAPVAGVSWSSEVAQDECPGFVRWEVLELDGDDEHGGRFFAWSGETMAAYGDWYPVVMDDGSDGIEIQSAFHEVREFRLRVDDGRRLAGSLNVSVTGGSCTVALSYRRMAEH